MLIWSFNEMKMIKWRPKSDCVAPPHALETVRGRKETGYKDRIYMGGAQDEIEGVISMHIGKVLICIITKGSCLRSESGKHN